MPYMYIVECADGTYYVGSTIRKLKERLAEHQDGIGANYTRKRLPVEVVYWEQYHRIDDAFEREKQVQGWSRAKKKALINTLNKNLPELSRNYTDHGRPVVEPARTELVERV